MPGYYMKHDKEFLSTADTSKFNKNILDLNFFQECHYLYKIIEKSPKNSIILDIGAYNGDTSLYISKLLKKQGRMDIKIICFEPNKEHCSIIMNEKNKYGLNIDIYNNIISDDTKRLYMKKNEGPGTMYDTCYKSSVYYDSITIDSLNLEIDVEGHEPQVIMGSIQTLSDCKYLYVELWNDEHFRERHSKKMEGSHNRRVLKSINSIDTNFLPIQKIEKNIIFENFGKK